MSDSAPVIQINVGEVIRTRLPKLSRFIPRFLIHGVERLIRQKELNELLLSNRGREGTEFCHGVLNDMDVSYKINNPENLPDTDDKRVIYVSNHPLGGLDGICLIEMLANHHKTKKLHFVVNDLLTAVKPLANVFLPINKHGAQSRDAARKLDEAFEGDNPVMVFPAGLVSRMGKNGRIADLKWHKMAVVKAIDSHRDIIPLHFDGVNSSFFYKFAKLRTRLGLKFNFEMMLLPRELVNSRGRQFNVTVGKRICYTSLKGGHNAVNTAAEIRSRVYDIPREAANKSGNF